MKAFLGSLGAGQDETPVRMSLLLRDDIGDVDFQESGAMNLQALQINDDEADNGEPDDEETNNDEPVDEETNSDEDDTVTEDAGETET